MDIDAIAQVSKYRHIKFNKYKYGFQNGVGTRYIMFHITSETKDN